MAKLQLVGAGSQLWIHDSMITKDEFGNICRSKKDDYSYSRDLHASNGEKGSKGDRGNKGDRGPFATGIMYFFDSQTDQMNLPSGSIRFDNTNLENAVELYLSVLTSDSFTINAYVLDWTTYGSPGEYGHLYFVNTAEGHSFAHYRVTSVTFYANYFVIGVEHVSSDPIPFVLHGEKVNITFVPKGSPGSSNGLHVNSIDYNIRLDKATDQSITGLAPVILETTPTHSSGLWIVSSPTSSFTYIESTLSINAFISFQLTITLGKLATQNPIVFLQTQNHENDPLNDPWIDLDMSAVLISHGELLTQATFNAAGTFMMSMSANQRLRIAVNTYVTQVSTIESIGTYLSIQSMASEGPYGNKGQKGEPGNGLGAGTKGDKGAPGGGGSSSTLGAAVRIDMKSSQTFSAPSTTPLDFNESMYGNPTYIFGDFQHHTAGHFSYIESTRTLEALITFAISAEYSAFAYTVPKLRLSVQNSDEDPLTGQWTTLSECDVFLTLVASIAMYTLTASSNYLYTMSAGEKIRLELIADSPGTITVNESSTFLTIIERSGYNASDGLGGAKGETGTIVTSALPLWDVPLTMKDLIRRNMRDHGYNAQVISSIPPAASDDYYDIEVDINGNIYFISYPNLPYPTCANFHNNSPFAIESMPKDLNHGDIFIDTCNNIGIFKSA